MEIHKFLKNTDDKKAAGTVKILHKLDKISVEVLSPPLVDPINESYKNSITVFLKEFFLTMHFRQISVLNTFYKIYESVIKNQLILVLNNIFSPYLVAYQESYRTQHALTRLLREWRKNLDNNYTVVGVLMDLSNFSIASLSLMTY